MNLLILGANSDVAHEIAKIFACREKADIVLASRNIELLEKKAQDLKIRCAVQACSLFFDALDYDAHADFYNQLDPKPDGVVVAFGILGDQEKAQSDFTEARAIMDANFTGAASILEVVAADFARRGHGFIIGLSSVAGMRGRQSNYFYGAAKGAFSIYLSGLRNRLTGNGVHVMTVLPGFIQTKMTEGLDLPGALTATPQAVAEDIHRAFKKSRDVIYTKWFWKWVMMMITHIPEALFKRMHL